MYDSAEVRELKEKGISQEALKAIACVTILLDHIGAMFVPTGYTLRIIGRIAFPIFCFLLAEGAHYTSNPKRYALRLAAGMLLSEIPFDLAFRERLTWQSQSVMVTLLLGFLTVEAIQATSHNLLKLLAVAAGFGLAEFAHTDYGGSGVLLVVLFSQSRGKWWLQTVFVAVFACRLIYSGAVSVFGHRVPIEAFAVLAMIPIGLYSGKKCSSSRAIQWAFYLFYPVHLAVLMLIRMRLYG